MGHFTYDTKAIGKNRQDAEAKAVDDFYYEEGHRCDLRDQEFAEFVRKVPPKKDQVTTEYHRGIYGQRIKYEIHSMVEDPTAPAAEWLEEWHFIYDYHC